MIARPVHAQPADCGSMLQAVRVCCNDRVTTHNAMHGGCGGSRLAPIEPLVPAGGRALNTTHRPVLNYPMQELS